MRAQGDPARARRQARPLPPEPPLRPRAPKIWPALWTFAKHPSVQPTNNHAERALRGAVIYRQLSLGSQSEHGERRIARLLSAHTTCRLQRRSLHAYLIDALSAHARGDPAPLLA
jgi:transposase